MYRCAMYRGRMVAALVCEAKTETPTVLYVNNIVVAKKYQRKENGRKPRGKTLFLTSTNHFFCFLLTLPLLP
uniref:Secreted protein n=1 Tax=Steinernema glaseri TaxID=37863 RepID=A0A1I7ZXP5_9BILA